MLNQTTFACLSCGTGPTIGNRLTSLADAPGIYFMCNRCILKRQEETGTVAVLFNRDGLRFLTPQQHAWLHAQPKPNDLDKSDDLLDQLYTMKET